MEKNSEVGNRMYLNGTAFQTMKLFPNFECFYHPSLADKSAIFSNAYTEKIFNFHFMPINLLHNIQLLARKKIKDCMYCNDVTLDD